VIFDVDYSSYPDIHDTGGSQEVGRAEAGAGTGTGTGCSSQDHHKTDPNKSDVILTVHRR